HHHCAGNSAAGDWPADDTVESGADGAVAVSDDIYHAARAHTGKRAGTATLSFAANQFGGCAGESVETFSSLHAEADPRIGCGSVHAHFEYAESGDAAGCAVLRAGAGVPDQ